MDINRSKCKYFMYETTLGCNPLSAFDYGKCLNPQKSGQEHGNDHSGLTDILSAARR